MPLGQPPSYGWLPCWRLTLTASRPEPAWQRIDSEGRKPERFRPQWRYEQLRLSWWCSEHDAGRDPIQRKSCVLTFYKVDERSEF